MMVSIPWFIEVNLPAGRKTRLRVDQIAELRDDFASDGKGKERRSVCRVIMVGGANIVVEGESMPELWKRMQETLQHPLHFIAAPVFQADEL